jgi:UDP-N-acetylmuramyl pentapeptide phosphotransferase/UDP-N-acetylglucosamine-1-phosphate transferase
MSASGYLLVVAAGALCAVVLAWLSGPGAPRLAVDQPNARSLHTRPIPRVGGLGILAGVLPALVVAGVPWGVTGGAAMLGAVSFMDDRKGLPILARFGTHFAASLAFLLSLPDSALSTWLLPFVTIAMVWMINLYNFMDGSDGLAGGMAISGFGAYAIGGFLGRDPALAVAALSVCAAALSFLRFNFHPARVFMGDAGSIALGFLAASLGILGWARGLWSWWFPVAAFAPFIADATITLVKRIARRERFWEAHRTHYYQRLVQSGMGHRRTALIAYALMLASLLAAVAGLRLDSAGRVLALGSLAAVHLALGLWVDARWVAFQQTRADRV